MKILVTGAAGYIGKHIIKFLEKTNNEILVVDNSNFEFNKKVKKLNVDIFDGASDIYKKLMEPDVVLHLAWKDGFNHNSDSHMMYLSNHYNFINNLIKGGLKHIAIMGTMHEIGYFEGEIDENTPCNPLSMYGIAKDSLRRSVVLLADKNNVCLQWIRGFYLIGDDCSNHSIFSKISQAELKGEKYFPLNSGKNKYDFIDIDEFAKRVCLCIMQTDIRGVINCCSGHPVSLSKKVEEFITNNKYKIRPKYNVFPDRLYDSPAIWGSNKKILEIIKNGKC